MNIKDSIRKIKKRFKQFGTAINQNNIFAVEERAIPAYCYLLYDEEEIVEWQHESIRQVRELLIEINDIDNNTIEG